MADTSLCPGCGSMLPLPDLDGHATCPSCGRTTRSEPTRSSPPAERAPDGPADAVGASSVDAPETGGPRADGPDDALAATLAAAGQRPLRPPPDWSERSRPGRGCVIAAFAGVVLFVAGVAVFAFSSAQDDLRARLDPSYSPYDDLLVLGGTAQLLDVGGDGPEVIVTVQETDGGDLVRRLARIRFADGEAEVVWQSGPIADDAHRAQVAAYDDTLFVGIDREVAALELDTGETRWRAEVRDDVASGCEGCFAVVGGRLVVRTADAYLTAFGPASSEQQWSRRLGSVAASTSVAGDRLVVVDEPEAPGVAASAVVVDPATGRDGAATSPSCPAPEWSPRPLGLTVGDEVHAIPGSDDVVAAFGFGDGCVARWNPGDSSVRWATPVEGVSSIDDDAVVVDEAVMAFAETGGGVVAVDLETGAVATMELPPD
ncbi:MAG: PQQ-binding-like beta-propeller repeat protein, partial [Acidimicrobiales bacterium]|nr:PQQ-binding-like beta-propeller repeat protein [Acidimicrobiales bacterium]